MVVDHLYSSVKWSIKGSRCRYMVDVLDRVFFIIDAQQTWSDMVKITMDDFTLTELLYYLMRLAFPLCIG